MTTRHTLQARIRTLRHEADNIISVELIPISGTHWPRFTPGAHIDLHLPNGLTRSYSLLNDPAEPDRYVLGILADAGSRGGSRYIHDHFRCGHTLSIGAPRNAFPLDENAPDIVLLAGGIGITPILCMYRRLRMPTGDEGGVPARRVSLIYCARTRTQAAFTDQLAALGGDVHLHFDDEHGGAPFDLSAFMARQSPAVHAYCCGPSRMLDAFEAACAASGVTHVHVERFIADAALASAPRAGYRVELARSGLTLDIGADESLLDKVLAAGIDVDHGCMEGVCGACETAVLRGCPDHRDAVLTAAEKASGKVMMLCVSGCRQGPLVLDL